MGQVQLKTIEVPTLRMLAVNPLLQVHGEFSASAYKRLALFTTAQLAEETHIQSDPTVNLYVLIVPLLSQPH